MLHFDLNLNTGNDYAETLNKNENAERLTRHFSGGGYAPPGASLNPMLAESQNFYKADSDMTENFSNHDCSYDNSDTVNLNCNAENAYDGRLDKNENAECSARHFTSDGYAPPDDFLTLMVADPPNYYKGDFAMTPGFLKIPRSILHDPLFESLTPNEQHVFITILKHACYKPQKFNDHGKILDLKPGQLCISERELATLCHKSITRIKIQRSIEKLKKVGFLLQKVSHKKSVLTICIRGIFDDFNEEDEPRNEPKVSQTRAKVEPETKKDKKDKNVKKTTTPPNPQTSLPQNENAVVVFSDSDLEKAKQSKFYDSMIAFSLEPVNITYILRHYCEQEIEQAIKIVNSTKNVKSKAAYFVWALKEKPTVPKTEEEIKEDNQKWAFEYIKNQNLPVDISADFCLHEVNIHMKGSINPGIFPYVQSDFRDKFVGYINSCLTTCKEMQKRQQRKIRA